MYKIIIATFFMYSSCLYSFCKIDEDRLDSATAVPRIAKTILFGKIKKMKNDKLVFISEKPWPPVEFDIVTVGCLGMRGIKDNDSVIFMSEVELKKINTKSVDRTLGAFDDISELSSIAEGLSSRSEILPGEPNLFWKYCQGDASCVQINDNCNKNVGVNYRYKDNLEKYYLEHAKNNKCEDLPKRKKNLKVVSKCVDYFCS